MKLIRDDETGLIDWAATWEAQGPEPAELQKAAQELVRLARAGWQPHQTDCDAAVLLRDGLQWSESRPTGLSAVEVQRLFSTVLRTELSEPVQRLVTAAAKWEPVAPRPGCWGESMTAVLITGDIWP